MWERATSFLWPFPPHHVAKSDAKKNLEKDAKILRRREGSGGRSRSPLTENARGLETSFTFLQTSIAVMLIKEP